jgi:oligopeptidase B
VGTATARNPGGELFGSVYTEVPYVDVLRTASNPRLPLTEYEYLEFGDPAHNPQDFATLLRLSPVDALGPGGAPGVFVLCRTAVNDRQVYAYESFKWVDALRGKAAGGKPKLVGLNHGQGHFTRGDQLYVDRSEDLILLETATQ